VCARDGPGRARLSKGDLPEAGMAGEAHRGGEKQADRGQEYESHPGAGRSIPSRSRRVDGVVGDEEKGDNREPEPRLQDGGGVKGLREEHLDEHQRHDAGVDAEGHEEGHASQESIADGGASSAQEKRQGQAGQPQVHEDHVQPEPPHLQGDQEGRGDGDSRRGARRRHGDSNLRRAEGSVKVSRYSASISRSSSLPNQGGMAGLARWSSSAVPWIISRVQGCTMGRIPL